MTLSRVPMRPPRFTTRRLMVLSAVVFAGLALVKIHRQRESYLAMARSHGLSEYWRRVEDDGGFFDVRERIARQISYHARMRLKYERAARYPWLPVPPDPPPPE